MQLHEKGIPKEKIYATGIPLSNKFLLKYDKSFQNSSAFSVNSVR